MCMIALFQAQKDTTATARSPRRSHIGALNTFETRTHPLSFASFRHTLHHTNHPSTALSLSSCSSTKCPSLSTPGHGLCSIPSIIRRAEGDNATRSRHSLSLSSRAHSTHKGLQHSNHLYYSSLLCRLPPPPASFTQPPGLFSHRQMCSFSLHHSHTHVGSTHTRSTHTPQKISASGRATLPWEEHSLKDKKTRPRSPSSPFLRHRISLLFTRCSAARAPPSSPRGCHSPPTSPQSGSPTTHSSHSAW